MALWVLPDITKMRMRLDWKYVVTLVAALVGIAVPVWLWQVDLHAKSLVVKLVSAVELQAPIAPSIPDIQLTVGGTTIASPVLYTLEIFNNGSKPIPTADFESPLELKLNGASKVVRASIASTEPADVSAEVETTPELIRLKPLLLNPGDKLRIAILTSGKISTVIPRARIAGVSKVEFENALIPNGKRTPILVNAAFGIVGMVLYFVFGASIAPSSRSKIPRVLSSATMAVLLVLSTTVVLKALDLTHVEKSLNTLWPLIPLFMGASGFVFYWALRWFRRQ